MPLSDYVDPYEGPVDWELDPRPCVFATGQNQNVCVAEGCFNEECCEPGWKPGAIKQWGIIFSDGSVRFSHFNGSTQEKRIRAEHAEIVAMFPTDNIRVASRWLPDGEWVAE